MQVAAYSTNRQEHDRTDAEPRQPTQSASQTAGQTQASDRTRRALAATTHTTRSSSSGSASRRAQRTRPFSLLPFHGMSSVRPSPAPKPPTRACAQTGLTAVLCGAC